MIGVTEALHSAFLRPLGNAVIKHSDVLEKPFDLDLQLPLPPCLRIYMYSLVAGGRNRTNEYKAVLRVPGQSIGAYGAFDHEAGRLTLLVGYDDALDVFVFWDASLHYRFKNGGNIQVKQTTVLQAAATGSAQQVRSLTQNRRELVLACRSRGLAASLVERLLTTRYCKPA
jgi:hypothetical protein